MHWQWWKERKNIVAPLLMQSASKIRLDFGNHAVTMGRAQSGEMRSVAAAAARTQYNMLLCGANRFFLLVKAIP